MPGDDGARREHERLARAYDDRSRHASDALTWSWLRPEAQWLDFMIDRFVAAALAGGGWTPQTVGRCRLLEVGAGTGQRLRATYQFGLRDLTGIELLADRAREGAALTPMARLLQADMAALPFADRSFDCVTQLLAFSSCLDDRARRDAAREMLRVLRDDGRIVWVDLKDVGGKQAYLRGVSPRELAALFPGTQIRTRSLGVMPEWLGAVTSVANQGLLRSLLRQVSGRRSGWLASRPITKFPAMAAALLEHWPPATCYVGAVIRKPPGRA